MKADKAKANKIHLGPNYGQAGKMAGQEFF